MSQHDLDVANGSGSTVRADINSALLALGSLQKGASAPSAPIAGMFWLEDDNPSSSLWTLRIYDGADWSVVGSFDVTNNRFTPAGGLIGIQTFSTPGTATYTETPGTRAVLVKVQAGGGGSGGCAATTAGQWAVGRSGGGGGYGEKYITSSFSGVTVTVGAGGTAGSAGNNDGGVGGTSSFGAHISCSGGGAGGGSGAAASAAGFTSGAAAAGGTASSADLAVPGSPAPGVPFALSTSTAYRTAGGSSHLGAGGYAGSVTSNNLAAEAGRAYGGGAAGPINCDGSFSASAGSAGGQGIVIVYEFG